MFYSIVKSWRNEIVQKKKKINESVIIKYVDNIDIKINYNQPFVSNIEKIFYNFVTLIGSSSRNTS